MVYLNDLFYNYPNPVTEGYTTFRCFLEKADRVEIKVYSSTGFLVETINSDVVYENEYNEVSWNATNLPEGLYLANLVIHQKSEKESRMTKVLIVN